MYIDEKLIKILEPHLGETIDVSYAISLIKTITEEYGKVNTPDVSICPFEAYAVFCIECDRQGLKPINHKDYLEMG